MTAYLLALLTLACTNICLAFAFAPKPSSSAPSRAATCSQRQRVWNTAIHSFIDVPNESTSDADGIDSTVTRRKAIGGSLALLTTPFVVEASDEDTDTSSAQTFNVLFRIQLDPSKPAGDISELEIECHPDWAPLATARFKELVELGFYKDAPFFRVLPNFVAQFGISADPNLNKQWMFCDAELTKDTEGIKLCKPALIDEPRAVSNKKGTLSFATSGKNTRRTQIFVNTGDNGGPPNFLDGQGFVPFAKVVRGMDVAKQLNGEYGGKVNQGEGAYYGGEYFSKVFPRLSVIKEVKVL